MRFRFAPLGAAVVLALAVLLSQKTWAQSVCDSEIRDEVMYVNKVKTEDKPAGTRCIKFVQTVDTVYTYMYTKYPYEKCVELNVRADIRLKHKCGEFLRLPQINGKSASRFFSHYERDVGKIYTTDKTRDKGAPYYTQLKEKITQLEEQITRLLERVEALENHPRLISR